MNENLFGSRLIGGNTAYKRSNSDFYPAPPEVTQALIDFLDIDQTAVIWEPACGEGHMVEVFKKNGYTVIGTDILTGTDYLTVEPMECDWIITNPPFSLSQNFIERSTDLHKPFAFLLKSQYWHAAKRYDLFNDHRPKYVLPLTWRPDFLFKQRGKGAPLMDVMWVVWEGVGNGTTTYMPLKKPI